MTFDDELELHKIKKIFPSARLEARYGLSSGFYLSPPHLLCVYVHRLLLRIRADCPDLTLQLGIKYGCSVSVGKSLLDLASSIGLSVVGVRQVPANGCLVVVQEKTCFLNPVSM